MTEPMVTEDDREIARRWLSEGQINVDQMGRAAVLVAIRQEYLAALAAEREECARVADDYKSWHEGAHLTGEYFAAEKIAAAIRARGR